MKNKVICAVRIFLLLYVDLQSRFYRLDYVPTGKIFTSDKILNVTIRDMLTICKCHSIIILVIFKANADYQPFVVVLTLPPPVNSANMSERWATNHIMVIHMSAYIL